MEDIRKQDKEGDTGEDVVYSAKPEKPVRTKSDVPVLSFKGMVSIQEMLAPTELLYILSKHRMYLCFVILRLFINMLQIQTSRPKSKVKRFRFHTPEQEAKQVN